MDVDSVWMETRNGWQVREEYFLFIMGYGEKGKVNSCVDRSLTDVKVN